MRRACAGLICLSLLAACGQSHNVSITPALTRPDLNAKEAPMLAARVAAGALPPLEQRLPENPLVASHDFDGYEGSGVYGGLWRRFHGLLGLLQRDVSHDLPPLLAAEIAYIRM